MEFFSNLNYTIGNGINSFLQATNGFFTPFFKFITFLGNGGAIFILISIGLLCFKSTRKAGIISLFSLLLGFILTNLILKNVVARPRPFSDETSTFYTWWTQAGSLFESGYSFPSGHTTSAMAFAFTLFLCFKKKTSWLCLLIPLLMGFTRIYFMVHYASDILGGLVVGAICATISFFCMKYFEKFTFMQKFLSYPSIFTSNKTKKE